MKKTGFVAALAVMALLAVILVGCGSRLTMTYANEKQYSAGSGEVPASVRELDVDWSSGACGFRLCREHQRKNRSGAG